MITTLIHHTANGTAASYKVEDVDTGEILAHGTTYVDGDTGETLDYDLSPTTVKSLALMVGRPLSEVAVVTGEAEGARYRLPNAWGEFETLRLAELANQAVTRVAERLVKSMGTATEYDADVRWSGDGVRVVLSKPVIEDGHRRDYRVEIEARASFRSGEAERSFEAPTINWGAYGSVGREAAAVYSVLLSWAVDAAVFIEEELSAVGSLYFQEQERYWDERDQARREAVQAQQQSVKEQLGEIVLKHGPLARNRAKVVRVMAAVAAERYPAGFSGEVIVRLLKEHAVEPEVLGPEHRQAYSASYFLAEMAKAGELRKVARGVYAR